ncbi:type I-C CRISPR-associated protein Cas7/Csd2 [Actinocatenispora rupis]|uniref:Type I-C CRISPR-associated protein Cas7/Csd2 n=1 Tax=Actinocatenispora rupis TaxID=519421 RepID=A0A8J3J269_9ACTN|nr:type I-C CRISPR-associated protein Cas7/Csd2 [Actinocatenispora rupis]GID10186.1 type I-C CRISPR-associated protein Cas7/Csd2 [Actinocatenispora rupis]
MTDTHLDPTRRHDVVLLFDVTDGNPNGDPDAANQPRTDEDTGHGLVTDVAIKRKIRDVVPLLREGDPRYGIFVEAGHALNTRIDEAKTAVSDPDGKPNPAKAKDAKKTATDRDAARRWLCDRYFDIRMFGAVLSTGEQGGAGKVRGPMQFTFARSIDPIQPTEHTVTRVTQTRQTDIDDGQSTEFGTKWTVPYGLYRAHGFYSAARADDTGITSTDLQTLWHALQVMFDHDRSAARGEMKLRGLYVFSHPTKLGVAPADKLFHLLKLELTDPEKPARAFTDYTCTIDHAAVPAGIELTNLTDQWPTTQP